jgi:hypothetical protein
MHSTRSANTLNTEPRTPEQSLELSCTDAILWVRTHNVAFTNHNGDVELWKRTEAMHLFIKTAMADALRIAIPNPSLLFWALASFARSQFNVSRDLDFHTLTLIQERLIHARCGQTLSAEPNPPVTAELYSDLVAHEMESFEECVPAGEEICRKSGGGGSLSC